MVLFLREGIAKCSVPISCGRIGSIFTVDFAPAAPEFRGEGYVGITSSRHRGQEVPLLIEF